MKQDDRIRSPSVAAGSNHDAPVDVEQLLRIMRERSGAIPVNVDTTGWVGHGVILRYRVGVDDALLPESVIVGSKASVEYVREHQDLIERAAAYNAALRDLRALWRRIDDLDTKQDAEAMLSSARVERAEFDGVLAERRGARMGSGVVTPQVLTREVRFLTAIHTKFAPAVARAERARQQGGTDPRMSPSNASSQRRGAV